MPYSDRHSIQFRWETFNLFNQVRFGDPDLSRMIPRHGESTLPRRTPPGKCNSPCAMNSSGLLLVDYYLALHSRVYVQW